MVFQRTSPGRPTWASETARIRRAVFDMRLLIVVLLAPLVGLMAYQALPITSVAIGWPGDRLFLDAREGQSAADSMSFYGDEISSHARSGRSRWTHAGARFTLPGIGLGPLTLTIRAQGWPADAFHANVTQPTVAVFGDGSAIGSFTPTTEWQEQRFTIPASLRQNSDLTIILQASHTFTSTSAFADPRAKGLRVEQISIQGQPSSDALVIPPARPLILLTLNAVIWLMALLALTGRPNLSFVLATLLVAGLAIGLAMVRGWAVALLPWLLGSAMLTLALAWRGALAGLLVRLIRAYQRGNALNYGLIAALVLWLLALVTRLSLPQPGPIVFETMIPDSLLYGLLGTALVLLVLVLGRNGLPRLADRIVALFVTRSGALAVLLLFLAIWMGYLASVISILPYPGHADYADNAVVARNLVAGRGWVVDYVTQFYQLYPTITRPQATWPLLQPVWIAPFFALFGQTAAVAKLPNLLFLLGLAAALYLVGSRLWDRRIGVTAAILTLTSHLFFKLVIYVTSDLAFVLFSFGALALLERAIHVRSEPHGQRRIRLLRWPLLCSGLLTGLLLLQKPGSGGMMAIGMGLWLLHYAWRSELPTTTAALTPLRALWQRMQLPVLWGSIAIVCVLPLIGHNLATFGKPYYTTESHDAWVLEYTDWDRIYAVYAPELGGDGIPDRSWILRWGFDRTQAKIVHQFEAVRDYLIPTWSGLSTNMAALFGRADKQRLLFEAGAWLAIFGILGGLSYQRRLLFLLLLAFGPYTLFLIFYWHSNEERYFVALMPWLALFAGAALWHGYDRIAAIGDRRWAPLGLVAALVALWLTVVPSWQPIAQKVREEPQLYAADLDLYGWIRANTPGESVLMTRSPWQVNWHTERPAVMIPYTTNQTVLLQLARYYGVRYLVLDSLQRPEPAVQRMIDQMLADPQLGFRRVYQTPVYVATTETSTRTLSADIYAFPDDYGGVAPIVSAPPPP